jgi:hypothetical protein
MHRGLVMAAKHAEADKATTHANGTAVPAPEAVEAAVPAEASAEEVSVQESDFGSKLAIAGVIGVGAALIEASLIPGIIIGAAAVIAPKLVPQIGTRLRPLFKSTIRGAYKLTERTREAFAEAQEQVQDMMAEARHEGQEEALAPKAAAEVHPSVKA